MTGPTEADRQQARILATGIKHGGIPLDEGIHAIAQAQADVRDAERKRNGDIIKTADDYILALRQAFYGNPDRPEVRENAVARLNTVGGVNGRGYAITLIVPARDRGGPLR